MTLSLVRNRRLTAREIVRAAFERSLKACDSGYRRRHFAAWDEPSDSPNFFAERSLVTTLEGLADYAEAYGRRYPGSKLGDDGVLGEAWELALRGFGGLLNGELGRLDGGALDAAARDLYRWAGFEGEL